MTGVDIEALLTEHEACEEGQAEAVAVFGAHLPPGVSVAWAVAVAAGDPALRPWVGWAVGRLCRPEEVGVVAGAYLRGAYLQWAALESADLRWVDLCEAMLCWAALCGADLRGADLYRADLYDSDLRGAKLGGANLRGAWLQWADLQGADLQGADLTDALRFSDDPPLEGWIVVNCRLRRAE